MGELLTPAPRHLQGSDTDFCAGVEATYSGCTIGPSSLWPCPRFCTTRHEATGPVPANRDEGVEALHQVWQVEDPDVGLALCTWRSAEQQDWRGILR